jgi:hypothetical protein
VSSGSSSWHRRDGQGFVASLNVRWQERCRWLQK